MGEEYTEDYLTIAVFEILWNPVGTIVNASKRGGQRLDLIYRYISVLINGLIVYLYFKIIFKVEIDNKTRLYYIVFSTLVVGTNLVLLLHSGGIRGLVSILLFILFANYFFKVKTGQAILGVGIVFVVATIGEVITYLILSGMGFSAAEIIDRKSVV